MSEGNNKAPLIAAIGTALANKPHKQLEVYAQLEGISYDEALTRLVSEELDLVGKELDVALISGGGLKK